MISGTSFSNPIFITSDESGSDSEMLVNTDSDEELVLNRKPKSKSKSHLQMKIHPSAGTDSDDELILKRKPTKRPLKPQAEIDERNVVARTPKEMTEAKTYMEDLDITEKYDIARAGLQMMLQGNVDGFHKFRGLFHVEQMWLNHLQDSVGDLFCQLSSKDRLMDYNNYKVPKRPLTPYQRPVDSYPTQSSVPPLPKINERLYGGNNSVFIKDRVKGGRKIWSTTNQPGYRSTTLTSKKGYEVFMSPECPPRPKGIYVSSELIGLIERCREKKLRFAVFVLHLKISRKSGHGNAMVYDCTKETLTRFEPHGGTSRSYDNVTLDNELYTFVAKYPHIFSGGYIAPNTFCPKIGPQVKEKLAGYEVKMGKVFGRDVKIEAGGFCSAWSQLILHRRILYPDSTNQEIAEMFDTEPQVLAQEIRAYMAAIVHTIKKIVK
jgi:hypothetical protein